MAIYRQPKDQTQNVRSPNQAEVTRAESPKTYTEEEVAAILTSVRKEVAPNERDRE